VQEVILEAPTGELHWFQAADILGFDDVITTHGLPMAIYTDRAHWAFYTPQANGPVNRQQLTPVGRALDRLGVEQLVNFKRFLRSRRRRRYLFGSDRYG
jgi:hypothetical protein